MEKTSRNSLKLTETLSELEAALRAWDQAESVPEIVGSEHDEPRRRAKEVLERLRLQLLDLSDESIDEKA